MEGRWPWGGTENAGKGGREGTYVDVERRPFADRLGERGDARVVLLAVVHEAVRPADLAAVVHAERELVEGDVVADAHGVSFPEATTVKLSRIKLGAVGGSRKQ